jgi:hypothetical protein
MTRVRYNQAASVSPYDVEKRLKGVADETDRQYTDRLLVELLAQQISTRRHLLVLSTMAVAAPVLSVLIVVAFTLIAAAH